MYNNTGGRSSRGFWLGRYQLDQVHIDQKWQVANHQAIEGYLTITQCLILTYNIWPEYERWVYVNGLIDEVELDKDATLMGSGVTTGLT